MVQLVLTARQLLDMLSRTRVAYMAAVSDGMPYIVPLWYQLDTKGEIPAVYVQLRAGSRMDTALRKHPQVCMAFSLMEKGRIDSALLMGRAQLVEEDDDCAAFRIEADELHGRRFMLKNG